LLYLTIATGERNIFILKHEAIITLTTIDNANILSQHQPPSAISSHFRWRIPTMEKVLSGFSVAVHSQDIPQIQKMNYLIFCLKGSAL
uniref:Leptin receptor long form n=1 Tax=Brugia timori TaxID=42155 RepID=A0A0R3RAX4_9BILA